MSVVEKGTWVKLRLDGLVVAVVRQGEPVPLELFAHEDDPSFRVNGHRLQRSAWFDRGLKYDPILEVEVLVDPPSDVLWARP